MKPWPVMVLAHNEERHIAACLDSIHAAEPGRAIEIFVMANGCTDRTEDIVGAYARKRPEVHLVSIALGDKCNAWNVFIHDTVRLSCPGREIYFFVTGDAAVKPGSLAAMARGLQREPHAHAASAVPATGRHSAQYRRLILDTRGLVANLYALRGAFVERLRALPVRLPLHFEGDDGLIGALVKWDLAPERGVPDDRRIVPCGDAAYTFDPLTPWRAADWKAYWRRLVRYARSRYEFKLLGPLLTSAGIGALPADIAELYPQAASLELKWDGWRTVPNLVALRQIRSTGRALQKMSGDGAGRVA